MHNAATERAGTSGGQAEASVSVIEMLVVIGGEYQGLTLRAPKVPTFEVEVSS